MSHRVSIICRVKTKKGAVFRHRFSLLTNFKLCFCGGYAEFFVFPLTCAAEKHLISEKPLIQRFFKGTGVVLAGIECSPKIFDFRANGIPVQERVEKVDTLNPSCFMQNGSLFFHCSEQRFLSLFQPLVCLPL